MTMDNNQDETIYLDYLRNNDPTKSILAHFSTLLGNEDVSWKPTAIDKYSYLDFAEARLRQFALCQREDGAILDPYAGEEKEFVTACFAKTGAILLDAGRCADLRNSILKAMDLACWQLANNKVPDAHGDFVTQMLVLAYRLLSKTVEENSKAKWSHDLSGFDPATIYQQVEPKMPLKSIRNWATYAMHGEMMRFNEGFVDSQAFINHYLPPQMTRFTPEGLYRDPNLPVAYDLAARDQLAGVLEEGYAGESASFLEVLLHRRLRTMVFL